MQKTLTTAVINLTPQNLADALDALVGATLETDHETAAVLTVCREGLRAISWNRFAATRHAREAGTMRETLAALDGQRLTVRATVLKFSRCIGWAGIRRPTILLGQIAAVDGALLSDHLWLHLGKRMADLDLKLGDLIEFSARVAPYRRALFRLPGEPMTFNVDYGLAYPTRCSVVKASDPRQTAESATLPPERYTAESAVSPMGEIPNRLESAPTAVPARAKVLFALALLSMEKAEGIALTELSARANVPPVAFLSQLKKLGNAGIVRFTPAGRVLLTNMPTQAMGVAQ